MTLRQYNTNFIPRSCQTHVSETWVVGRRVSEWRVAGALAGTQLTLEPNAPTKGMPGLPRAEQTSGATS